MKATITKRGAILLGKYVACDAHEETRPIRIVTHAHADHIRGLKRSSKSSEKILMTAATKELISVLKNPTMAFFRKVKELSYENSLSYMDEKITLYPVDHIIGAAQILVEDPEGTRILYTGDFKLPKTPIVECDILVIEATYGSPLHVRPFKNLVEDVLIGLVRRGLKSGPIYIFGYHGKLQETIGILRNHGIDVPVIVPESVYKVARVCEKYGVKLGECLLSTSPEGKSVVKGTGPYIGAYHMGSMGYVGGEAMQILLSGWEFGSPVRQVANKNFVVALSDHADFEELLEYVKTSKPKLVITDDYRVGDAASLALEITKRLGIKAKPMPR